MLFFKEILLHFTHNVTPPLPLSTTTATVKVRIHVFLSNLCETPPDLFRYGLDMFISGPDLVYHQILTTSHHYHRQYPTHQIYYMTGNVNLHSNHCLIFSIFSLIDQKKLDPDISRQNVLDLMRNIQKRTNTCWNSLDLKPLGSHCHEPTNLWAPMTNIYKLRWPTRIHNNLLHLCISLWQIVTRIRYVDFYCFSLY